MSVGAKRKGAQRVQRPRVEVYRINNDRLINHGEFMWRLLARNGKILADSGESYTRRHGAHRALHALFAAVTILRHADIVDLT